ncbi:IclR family transcriptional regulator [Natrinema sp. HArc-T2]|uniref:IclR family transcriptional regulator n=1 Tax=Natrinema sp. HArc-T2 TaxID=3242701 RepID=UPI00359E8C20
MTKKDSDRVRTTEQSLQIIDAVQSFNGATLAELVDHFDLARSTIHRHLTTLRHHGYIVKEGEQYHLGLKFYNRGEYARSRKQSYQLAVEAVQDIADTTNEEVDFLVANDGRAITVYESYHPDNTYQDEVLHPTETARHAGTCYHMHCIAGGKALLAELEDDELDRIIDQWGLPKRTENTITSREALFQDLEQIRERGIALSDEEYADGLRAVGRRILSSDGSVLGSLAVSAPKYRMQGEIFTDEVPDLLVTAVDELEEQLATTVIESMG